LLRASLRGGKVFAIVRNPERFHALESIGLKLLPWNGDKLKGGLLCHAIPPLPEPENAPIREKIESLAPQRIVYISSTGVYGAVTEAGAETPAAPNDERGRQRMREELWIASGNWSSLILRAAAIYGPGRGVHRAIREGRIPRSSAAQVVSRIHVDDLATLAEAGLFSDISGAWPVADDLPCASAEIAGWAVRLLGLPETSAERKEFTVSGRKVDGTAIGKLLGVPLAYPTWQAGVLASLAQEQFMS
jgi:nucleoside-diphosphate-sugar epimerase